MSRSFQAVDMVPLPKVSVSDAIALGTELVTWARGAGELPGPIAKSLRRVGAELEGLRAAARSSFPGAGEDSGLAREVDRVLDAAWAAAHWWCSGWARLPEASELVDMATEIRDAVFADGLRFTQFKFKAQWVASQNRLDLIDDRNLGRHFERLGGAAILATIRNLHKRYGEVLGITEMTMSGDTTSRRERLHAFLDAVRRYVIQISAHADPEVPASVELAEHLLKPLSDWQSRAASPPAGHAVAPAGHPEGEPEALPLPGVPATSPDEPAAEPALQSPACQRADALTS